MEEKSSAFSIEYGVLPTTLDKGAILCYSEYSDYGIEPYNSPDVIVGIQVST